MLEADKFLEWPLLWPPVLLIVPLRGRGTCRTLSVLTWRWNLVPVAARDSAGISSLTCTVCACCRRLSSREKRLLQ
jgi:hypothetical protein